MKALACACAKFRVGRAYRQKKGPPRQFTSLTIFINITPRSEVFLKKKRNKGYTAAELGDIDLV